MRRFNRTRTPAERAALIRKVEVEGWTVTRAAQAAAVPRRTADHWVARYRRGGDPRAEAALEAASEMTPLDYMLSVVRDPTASPERRDRMALAVAAFVHPKLASLKPRDAEAYTIEDALEELDAEEAARAAAEGAAAR